MQVDPVQPKPLPHARTSSSAKATASLEDVKAAALDEEEVRVQSAQEAVLAKKTAGHAPAALKEEKSAAEIAAAKEEAGEATSRKVAEMQQQLGRKQKRL